VKVLVTDAKGIAQKNVVVVITLAKNPGGSVLSGTITATTGNNGIAIFASQSLNKAGTGYQMQATAPALVGAQPAFSVLFNIR
jgi:ribosomal protein L35AE/L33A